MLGDAGQRKAIAVMIAGALLVVLGVFFVIASQPIVLQDFAFVDAEQGDEFYLDANGMVSSEPPILGTAGGVLLGAGVALATGVGGYVLGRRRR